ncbi:MAG TPA: hypothetical protein DHE23_13530 [Agrobacterium sp.]|uniref:hypothetical protein n=1 Tax=Agrobacterium tumefaciens TaxID=358 RepID=UPI000EEE23EC|nr:hypothetical protein [Agrobacterium tumefaciens]MEA1843376.1 hypothetical protein [Agrobacterium tumefaciens]HCV72209.1 hypothetical protein [Agrobacterium sp.]
MKHIVSIIREIEADDENLAALEGYKQIMLAGTNVDKVTVAVRDAAGNGKDVTFWIDEADVYAGFSPPIGLMA